MAAEENAGGAALAAKLRIPAVIATAASPLLLTLHEAAREYLIANPWQSLLVAGIWLVLMVGFSFALDVWAELRPKLVRQAADRVELWFGNCVQRHRRRYLQDLVFQHRNLDVKGLTTQAAYTLELDQVFVDLAVAPTPPHAATSDPLKIFPDELRGGRHALWSYLALHAERPSTKIVLLGPPGSGKTTLLRHAALVFALGRSPAPGLTSSRLLPVLLFLRHHATQIVSEPDLSLARLLVQWIARERGIVVPEGWLIRRLARGRCLVMLDGLDEVGDSSTRATVVRWIERQTTLFGNCPFILTSRPHGYRTNPVSGVHVLEVRPFNAQQVKKFAENWYLANEAKAQVRLDDGVRRDASTAARDLLGRLAAASVLSELAVNPLLLTMIATVHRYRSSLPGRRVDLYTEIAEVYLGKRQQAKELPLDLTPAQKQRVLEPLAWAMMHRRVRELGAEEAASAIRKTLAAIAPKLDPMVFLQRVEENSSLLLEREAGRYGFAHLTFQEFFAACHAQNNPQRRSELIKHIADPWWREALLLFCARDDATDIVSACLAADSLPPEVISLVLDVREERQSLAPDIDTALEAFIDRGIQEMEPVQRRPFAEAMLRRRLLRFRRLDERRSVDAELITNAEYQLFLEDRRELGLEHRPDHWADGHYPHRQGLAPILGLRLEDAEAFCQWLSDREGNTYKYRLPSIDEAMGFILPTNLATWTESGQIRIPRAVFEKRREWMERLITHFGPFRLLLRKDIVNFVPMISNLTNYSRSSSSLIKASVAFLGTRYNERYGDEIVYLALRRSSIASFDATRLLVSASLGIGYITETDEIPFRKRYSAEKIQEESPEEREERWFLRKVKYARLVLSSVAKRLEKNLNEETIENIGQEYPIICPFDFLEYLELIARLPLNRMNRSKAEIEYLIRSSLQSMKNGGIPSSFYKTGAYSAVLEWLLENPGENVSWLLGWIIGYLKSSFALRDLNSKKERQQVYNEWLRFCLVTWKRERLLGVDPPFEVLRIVREQNLQV